MNKEMKSTFCFNEYMQIDYFLYRVIHENKLQNAKTENINYAKLEKFN